MTSQAAMLEIRYLRKRLETLEAKLRQRDPAQPGPTFADLVGAWRGQSQTSKQDIDAVLYRRLELPEP